MKQFRAHTITFTAYLDKTDEHTVKEALKEDGCIYYLYGHEICPTSGRPHLQGMASSKKKTGWVSSRTIMHVERCKSPLNSVEYCKKDGQFVEWGTRPQYKKENNGRRGIKVAELLTFNDEDWGQLAPTTYNAATRALDHYNLRLGNIVSAPDVRGIWFVGKPGVGKSHRAREEYPNAFLKPQSKWWDGYRGEKNVILDDLDSDCLGHYLKIWADKWSCTGEVKNGTVRLEHEWFVVTSNFFPEELFQLQPKIVEAVVRRFKVIEVQSWKQIQKEPMQEIQTNKDVCTLCQCDHILCECFSFKMNSQGFYPQFM
ncbi:replication associated protein [Miresoil virus 429]|uniref:ATP-dependent helicase Rep n=1 Tax=Miresoil virus 429 TaxID=2911461 RepID=A0A9E8YXE0_9VIRU|nr:replication associated protein [Miresoil virus 429]